MAIKLDEKMLIHAVTGGCILGGGGGGAIERGLINGKLALDYSDLYLYDIDELEPNDILVCASLVGAPASKDKYMKPEYLVRCIRLFEENSQGLKVSGIITNEMGGEATTNGWLQSAVCGLPLVDSPCNGRAHPTGVMGSVGLHKDPKYTSLQTAVGGNPKIGKYTECIVRGTIDNAAKLVRTASVEAGGLVGVARNPITVEHAKANCALGAVKQAIELGKVFQKGLDVSPLAAVEETVKYLGGEIVSSGKVTSYELRSESGFDVGHIMVGDTEMTFWNEYMTLEKGTVRKATFPDLIMTFDAITGAPLPTSDVELGTDIIIISVPMKNLKLSSTMFDKELMEPMEDIVGKELLKYYKW